MESKILLTDCVVEYWIKWDCNYLKKILMNCELSVENVLKSTIELSFLMFLYIQNL